MSKKPPPGDHGDHRLMAELVSARRSVIDWRAGTLNEVRDTIIRETAVALVYNGVSHVVMMTTPEHLEDFALGFSLTEGILTSANQLYDIEVHEHAAGLELAPSGCGTRGTQRRSARPRAARRQR